MDKLILAAVRIFLSVIMSAGVYTTLSFFIDLLVGVTDYQADRLTIVYALVAGLSGIVIGLIIGIGDLGITWSGFTGLSAALILWLLDISLMENGGRYEFFSSTSQITLIVFTPALTLGGIVAHAVKSLVFNLFHKG